MARMNNVQAMAVLYDLALTIGGEASLEALCPKVLQRFLYHTGFPAGLIYSRPSASPESDWALARLEAVVGNYELIRSQGQPLRLPSALLEPTAALREAPELLAAFPARTPYRFFLRLPIEGFGGVLLLSADPPSSRLPLTELFVPVMSQLATAVLLCRRVEERTAALERANQELEAFSFSVSHDLRGPLRAIDGYSRILQEDYGPTLDDEGRRVLGLVRTSTERMGQLIDDLLSFSRMGRQEMEAVDFDVARLAQEVFAELQQASPESRVQLVIDELPPARGDRAMIRQVLVNLLSNAMKFSQRRPDGTIWLSGSSDGVENRYVVRDNGVGFDMRYVHKLFRVFQRLHSNDQFEGTGIGLAIVKRVIERNGGRVWAESEEGRGATFTFTLPCAASVGIPVPAELPASSSGKPAAR